MVRDAPGGPYAAEVAFALEVARAAGSRAAQAQDGPLDVTHKADRSLVTLVDRELDAFLVGKLRDRFPGDGVVGEESHVPAGAPSGARRCWFVDPIDGTTNFALGIGEFTVVVGLAEAGRGVVGAVVEPVGGLEFAAAEGAGARLSRAGAACEAIRVSDRADLHGARLVRSVTRRPSVTEQHLARTGVAPPARVGSLALRICQIAAGTFDFTYTVEFRGGPWDLCGPLAVLAEAGGTATDLEGRLVRVSPDPDDLPRSLLVSNGRLHDAVLRALADRPR